MCYLKTHSFSLHKTLTDGLESCGLLGWFLLAVSFWRHPFTAEDPLVNKWCNAKKDRKKFKNTVHVYQESKWGLCFEFMLTLKFPYYGFLKICFPGNGCTQSSTALTNTALNEIDQSDQSPQISITQRRGLEKWIIERMVWGLLRK